jgi:diguanylate cyclase (GGDEF)-like protein
MITIGALCIGLGFLIFSAWNPLKHPGFFHDINPWTSLAIAFLVVSLVRYRQLARAKASELKAVQASLESKKQEANRQKQESHYLKEMMDALQSSYSLRDTVIPLAKYCRLLLPSSVGAIFLVDQEEEELSPFVYWGSTLSQVSTFAPNACCALWRGSSHYISGEKYETPCEHIKTKDSPLITDHSAVHFCIPLSISREFIGLLYVKNPYLPSDSKELHHQRLLLTKTMAQQLALSISNLKMKESLQSQSIRDPLTSLVNRRYLDDLLKRELDHAKRHLRPLSVMMVDIDHFKLFNDTYGREGGDIVLKGVGSLLQKLLRVSDIVCRFGGEEFLLVLPESPLDMALKRSEDLRQKIAEHSFMIQGKSLKEITISIGISAFPEHGELGEELISAADQALFKAKSSGRNRTEVAEKPVLLYPSTMTIS